MASRYDRFEEQPFVPLADHLAKVKECVAEVEPMFQMVRRQDYAGLDQVSQKIFKLEHDADEIKTEIRRVMPKSFYLPIYRGDLLAYLKLQDDIADSVEDIAVGLNIKHLLLPPELEEPTFEFVQRVMTTCELLFKATDQLTGITEADFENGNIRGILDVVSEAEHAEWRADKAQFTLAQKLFALDDTMKATDIFLWSNVFRELGRLANHADNTAERLRRMLAR